MHHLCVGELGGAHGTATVSGVTGVDFNLYADGRHLIDEHFASAGTATSNSHDHAIDLGWLATGALSGSTLSVVATIGLTSKSAGSGFYGNLIVGDPPAANGDALRFAHAAAAFAGAHGAATMTPTFAAAATMMATQLASPRAHALV